jgi:hypothetical protein
MRIGQTVQQSPYREDKRPCGLNCPERSGFYEQVRVVKVFSSVCSWRLGSSWLWSIRMPFSPVFLFALCVSWELCAGWGQKETSMLPAQPDTQSSRRGLRQLNMIKPHAASA